jgi:outer membrane protein
MKRSLFLVCVLASGLGASALAQTGSAVPSAPAEATGGAKVAVIMFQAAVARTNEGQRDFADLEKKFEPKRQQLKQESDEIDALKKQLQTAGTTLSDQERASRLRTIDEKEKDLQRAGEDAQTEFQNAMGDAFNGLAQKVGQVMTEYAQKNGYSMVLDASAQQSPVLWASPATDITTAVIQAYNAKSGIPAPPPAAPAPQHSSTPAHPASH